MGYQLIEQYFPNLTDKQKEQFAALEGLYQEWNAKINVISRKDTENIYERHVLHSLCIAKLIEFKSGSSVLDLGTGGGFPGIPMAILFPKTQFTLIDGTKKKITESGTSKPVVFTFCDFALKPMVFNVFGKP